MAAPIENSTGINDQARRVNFASDDALGLNLDAAFGENYAIVAAANDHAIAFDLTLYFRVFAENQSLLRDDVALHIAVNAKGSGELQRAFHRHALIDKTGPLFAAAVG